MLLDDILTNKNQILNIFDKYGATNIRIMGSVSRREEREDSDIDFVIELPKNDIGSPDLQAHSDLRRELINFFKRNVHLGLHDQVKKQYPNDLKNSFELTRT